MKSIIATGILVALLGTSRLYSTAADDLLSQAIEQADLEKAHNALKQGADLNAHQAGERAPLEWIIWRRIGAQKNPTEAANLESIALELIKRMPTVSIDDFNLAAGVGGSLGMVKAMRPKIADINATGIEGVTPLMVAVNGYGDFDVVAYLIEQGAQVNPPEDAKNPRKGINLISLAMSPGKDKKKIIHYLLDHGARATIDNMRQAAINREGDVEMIKKMVAQGLDSNALFKTGMGETGTVFSWALEFGNNPEILIYLIQQGADVKALRFHEGTPLEMLMSPLDKAIETFYYSRSGGVNLDVLKAMLAHGAQVTDLTRALAQDDRAKVLSLVKEKNPNATTAGMLELSPPADPAKKSAVLSLLSP